MKTRNKTKKLLLSFVVIILLLTLSFIILAIKYTNLKNSKSMYKVEIIKVDKLNPIKAGTNNPTSNANIINSGETLALSFDLYTPNDEITYVATVKNIGDIKEICDLNHIDYLDLCQELPIPSNDGKTEYFKDGLHPNKQGHKIIARNIIKYLKNKGIISKNFEFKE